MADEEKTKFKLDLDNAAFVSNANQALESINKLGDKANLSGLIQGLEKATFAIGVVGVALFAMKEALDLTLEAEKINAINQQFEILTQNAGIATEKLKDGLNDAAKGLVDDTDLMEAANKALVKLETGFERLPEVMNLARQATLVMGGDLLQNFDAINNAIATGNLRGLRNLGIIIDQKKAYKDFAASIGESVDNLSKAGQQQAIMNAVLAQGEDRFKGVSGDVKQATMAWTQLKVSINEFGETFVLMFNKIFGKSVANVIESVGLSIRSLVNTMKLYTTEGAEHEKVQLENINHAILVNQKEIDAYQNGATENQKKGYDQVYTSRMEQLENIKKKLQDQLSVQKSVTEESKKESGSGGASSSEGLVDQEKKTQEKIKLEKELLDIKAKRIKSEEDLATDAQAMAALRDQEEINIKARAQNEIKEINRQLKDGEISDYALARARIEEIERNSQNAVFEMRIKAKDDAIKVNNELVRQQSEGSKGFVNGWNKSAAEATKDLKNMSRTGEMVQKSLVKNFAAGFRAIGDGSKDMSEAVKDAAFGMLGEVATKEGEMMMLSSFDPLFGGPQVFAAGAALVALGGLLGAAGGSGGVSSGSSGGNNDYSGINTTPLSEAASQTVSHKSVNLVLNGPILGDESTARWITDQVRNASDATAFTVQSVSGGFGG